MTIQVFTGLPAVWTGRQDDQKTRVLLALAALVPGPTRLTHPTHTQPPSLDVYAGHACLEWERPWLSSGLLQTTTPRLLWLAAAAFTYRPSSNSSSLLILPTTDPHNAQHTTMTFTRAWLNTLEAMPRSQVSLFRRGRQRREGGRVEEEETHESATTLPLLYTNHTICIYRPSLAGLASPS